MTTGPEGRERSAGREQELNRNEQEVLTLGPSVFTKPTENTYKEKVRLVCPLHRPVID